jgi:hypothetical protein
MTGTTAHTEKKETSLSRAQIDEQISQALYCFHIYQLNDLRGVA